MKTAEAIENLTDAGDFEVLATRVLRLINADCQLLEHMGVNAQGKTIANPVDSFCQVPGSDPPRFVMAAFTLSKVETLKAKWFFDHTKSKKKTKYTSADDGDLVKANRQAQTLRKDYPDAEFTVHLCTNKRISADLIAEVIKKAGKFDLRVEFLAQSRFRDCLDMNPEGQWLRKVHLGIDADQVSLSLLHCLSQKSIARYWKRFSLTQSSDFVPTSNQEILQKSIESSELTTHIVYGTSGMGKSVVSYQVLRNHINNNGIGFWIPEEIIERSSSLEEAIYNTLQSLHSLVEKGAGKNVLNLITHNKPLLFVIDDVNKCKNPVETIRKLIAWSRPSENSSAKGPVQRTYSIIIPTWTAFWIPFRELYQSPNWLSETAIGLMDENDAIICLEKSLRSEVEAYSKENLHSFVSELGFDPVLIVMFAELLRTNKGESPFELTQKVMERFIAKVLSELSAETDSRFIRSDYDNILIVLAGSMLVNRILYPTWMDLSKWLSEKKLQMLRDLIKQNKLCHLIEHIDGERFEFRQDRILDYFLSACIGSLLNSPEENSEVLKDPFYSVFAGRAITSRDYTEESIKWISEHAPLALFEALRFINQNDNHKDLVVSHIKNIILTSKNKPDQLSFLLESCQVLEEIDSKHVIEVTDSIKDEHSIRRARLANGDARSGIIEFSNLPIFIPAMNDSRLDQILKRAFQQHHEKLVSECNEYLSRSNLNSHFKKGVLTLAGFLADQRLSDNILQMWNSTSEKEDILVPSIWAACRCGFDNPPRLLDPLLGFWATLSDDKNDKPYSQRYSVSRELEFAMRREIHASVLSYLVRIAHKRENLYGSILSLLHRVDHPIALQFQIEALSRVQDQIEREGGFSVWELLLQNQWDPTRSNSNRLSPLTLNAIRRLWESAAEEQSIRKTAFKFWVHCTDNIDVLRSISYDLDSTKQLLWRRTILGDPTVIPLVKHLLASDSHWFNVIQNIWHEEFIELTDNALKELSENTPTDYSGGHSNDHYALAHLLRDIPPHVAESLLIKYWDHLQYSPLFTQAALYIGTSKTLEHAANAIPKYPSDNCAFIHISQYFGFITIGLRDRISLLHLEALQPYLNLLDDFTINQISDFCENSVYRKWSMSYIVPEVKRRIQAEITDRTINKELMKGIIHRHAPSDIELKAELDEIEKEKQHRPFALNSWFDGFQIRGDDPNRWITILASWYETAPSISRYGILSTLIQMKGRRGDLVLLDKQPPDCDPDIVKRIVSNVRFSVKRRSLE